MFSDMEQELKNQYPLTSVADVKTGFPPKMMLK